MADWTNINVPTLAPGAAPSTNTANSGGDRFRAQYGARYLLRANNAGGAPITLTFDDPTSATPASAKQFNPDVDVAVTNAQARAILIDSNRFADANGWVNITYSGTPTMTVEIYGPL